MPFVLLQRLKQLHEGFPVSHQLALCPCRTYVLGGVKAVQLAPPVSGVFVHETLTRQYFRSGTFDPERRKEEDVHR